MDVTLPPAIGLLIVAILLGLNAIFVAAEFAYVTVRRTQLQHLAEEGDTRARFLLGALQNLDFYVAASQLGITMATIALGFLGEPVLASLIEPPVEDIVGPIAPALSHTIAIAVAFILITALHIIVGEFVPKSIALSTPDRTSLWLTYPMEVFVRIFRPMIWLLNESGNALLRLVGVDLRPVGDEPLRVEDIAMTLETSASAGLISRRELDLTRNTLRLGSIIASDLMTPRNEIVAIPLDASTEDVRRIFALHQFTRYPVYEGTLDNVIGTIDVKTTVFELVHDADWKVDIEPPLLLPETIRIENALTAAERAGATMMVLVDEFGGTAGILSIFDVVQYIAGGLPDEYRVRPLEIEAHEEGRFVVPGSFPLVEFEDEFGIEIPDFESHTISGMIAETLQRIPEEGDEIEFEGYRLRVETVSQNRVEQVSIVPTETDDEAGNE